MTDVAANVARVRERIAAAARRAARRPDDVTLVAVTKGVDPPRIAAAVAGGVTDLGENRVQEAEVKIPAANALARRPLRWHMVGHLQRNKAKKAVALFDVVHSVDNSALAQELSRRTARMLDVLVQVNVAGAAQQRGIAPAALPALLRTIVRLPGLRVVGLMAIAPLTGDPETVRPAFRRLRELRDEVARLDIAETVIHLSMGMTADFAVAVEEGATIVRIGRAIFGERPL